MIRYLTSSALVLSLVLVACGGDPPAKNPNDLNDAPPTVEQGGGAPKKNNGGGPVMQQELGSMDLRAVEKLFNNLLNGPLEKCHQAGRGRVEYLSGDVKLFTRVAADGSVRYG